MKLFALGSISIFSLPIMTVVSCGNNKNVNEHDEHHLGIDFNADLISKFPSSVTLDKGTLSNEATIRAAIKQKLESDPKTKSLKGNDKKAFEHLMEYEYQDPGEAVLDIQSKRITINAHGSPYVITYTIES